MQSRREIAFLKLGLEHARLTLLMGQAHLARVHNNSAEDQRDFQRKYEALMKFRETHESSGISWMSVLNSFEDYNFYCSLNGKKELSHSEIPQTVSGMRDFSVLTV